MRVTDRARVDHQARAQAQTASDEGVVRSRLGQQGGDGRLVDVHSPIAQDDERAAAFDGGARFVSNRRQARLEPGDAGAGREHDVDDSRRQRRGVRQLPSSRRLRIGDRSTTRAGRGASSSMKPPCPPSIVVSDITDDSRYGSIDGLVTWAKRCRKKSLNSRARADSAAGGASSPIEPTASCASAIIGRRSSSISSREQPNTA